MANITTQTIRVDLSTDKVLPTAFTHQNDTARTLEFSMYNKGMPYTMTGNTVKFAYKSPIVDGAYTVITGSGMASGTVSGNKVTVTLPNTYTAISGVGMLTMIITPTSGTVRPVNIRLVVQKSADGDDTVMGASDFPESLYDYMDDWLEENEPTEIANLKAELKFSENLNKPYNSIYTEDLESGYYSTNTGEKLDSTSFFRSKILYPISSGVYYSTTGEQVRACLYDENKNYVSSIYFNAKTSAAHTYIPDSIKYCGIFFSSSNSITDYVSLKRYTGSEYDVIEAPFDGNYYYIPGRWMQGDGVIATSENLSLLGIFDPVPGTKYYVGNSADNQCLCKDASGQLITVEKTSVPPYGQFFTVPSNAKLIYFNLYANVTYNNIMTNYVAKITNKKVLCIGDSVTWLDGRGTYGGTTKLLGYQNVLRKAGFEVWSAGFSGYPYAEGVHESETESLKYSIYNEIVNKNYDVSGYDIIVLAGGLNDMLYNTPLGTRETVYTNRTFDSGTFNGAISGIISYIRTNNPTAKIVICTATKSEAVTRVFTRAISYINEIDYNATFWSAKLCNIFRDMNVQPSYDGFDTYFYDATHPNNAGMELVGNQILHIIEET